MKNFLSPKMLEALEFASDAHKEQKRKNTSGVPYISHCFAVALILAKAGFSESVVIAGVLHDVIEDTKYAAEDIINRFGQGILNLVLGVTEDKTLDKPERKQKYLEVLSRSSAEVKAISAADLLANLLDILLALREGHDPWPIFGRPSEEILNEDRQRMEIIKEVVDLPFLEELINVENEVRTLTEKLEERKKEGVH